MGHCCSGKGFNKHGGGYNKHGNRGMQGGMPM